MRTQEDFKKTMEQSIKAYSERTKKKKRKKKSGEIEGFKSMFDKR